MSFSVQKQGLLIGNMYKMTSYILTEEDYLNILNGMSEEKYEIPFLLFLLNNLPWDQPQPRRQQSSLRVFSAVRDWGHWGWRGCCRWSWWWSSTSGGGWWGLPTWGNIFNLLLQLHPTRNFYAKVVSELPQIILYLLPQNFQKGFYAKRVNFNKK